MEEEPQAVVLENLTVSQARIHSLLRNPSSTTASTSPANETHFHTHYYYTQFNTVKSWSNIEVMFLKIATQKQCTVELWEHPHDSTSPSSVTQHTQFSVSPHSKILIHAPNQTTTISPFYITAMLPLSFYLSPTSPCRGYRYG